jgi:hypothetical protein
VATITFDTLKASRNLKAAGFDEPQADAIIDTFGDAFSDTVATKTDIAEVKADIAKLEGFTKTEIIAEVKADIAKLAVANKAEIANLKAEMFRALWIQGAALVGLQLTIAGLLFAALKMLSEGQTLLFVDKGGSQVGGKGSRNRVTNPA